ncbi:DUF6528 family protein [Stenomitos frigidus]|uniref:WD40 repeat domain-containing protein n=1 Tax=Stenomitos frigidus ULC18 TaxID=2107698 RepID=A0A2T1DSV6_9CYAN|nr:DUF6528 family protein [Stenomitos frigidus]PSB23589.1 hypothetical protein C7B82_30365 [Stenomitos frigidus ULC18]
MRKFLFWIGWSYVGFSILWLILRLGFSDHLWSLLLVNATADYLFVPLPVLLVASLLHQRWQLLLGLSIPVITFGVLVGAPSLPPFANAQEKNVIPLSNHIDTADTLFVCGWDEVFALKLTSDAEKPAKIWSWKAATSPGLPKLMVTKFATTDECKPIEQGRKVLITSSTNGVALVEQATGKALFYASVPGAHSADLLPNNRIVVAGADSPIGGHTLQLFDANTSARPLWKTELYSGHGVYWDQAHTVLWALGRYELRQYELVRWESKLPELRLKQSFLLPSPGGHDLSPNFDRSTLFITTDTDVVLFDLQSNTFISESRMNRLTLVKSISVHPVTKRLAYVQAEGGHWWSSRIHLLESKQSKAEQTILLKGERLYKARWID